MSRRDEPIVLGIETSCDETGVGIVRGHTLLANTIASSMDEHARFGGVVPEVASRAHLEAMTPTVESALAAAGLRFSDIDAVAVTAGPGLAGALLVGVAAAKAYALGLGVPLYGVNHLAAHVAVDQLEHGPLPKPSIALLVSGGHSSLLLVPDVAQDVISLGSTVDDAAGEAFDKVARVLGLPFPGGPHIDRAARDGSGAAVAFPRGKYDDGTLDFSFSGLKTAVARWVEAREAAGEAVPVADVAASFQEAVVDVLTRKALQACARYDVKDLLIGGRRGRQLPAAGPGPGALRRGRGAPAGAAARPVHRQRRDGGGARRGPGVGGREALHPGDPGRLVAPDHRRQRLIAAPLALAGDREIPQSAWPRAGRRRTSASASMVSSSAASRRATSPLAGSMARVTASETVSAICSRSGLLRTASARGTTAPAARVRSAFMPAMVVLISSTPAATSPMPALSPATVAFMPSTAAPTPLSTASIRPPTESSRSTTTASSRSVRSVSAARALSILVNRPAAASMLPWNLPSRCAKSVIRSARPWVRPPTSSTWSRSSSMCWASPSAQAGA